MNVKPEEFKIDPDNGCIIGSDDCPDETKSHIRY